MDSATSALIITVAQLVATYGPALTKGIVDLVHGNPQQTGESDDAYVARVNAQIDSLLADADVKAQTVIDDQPRNLSARDTGAPKIAGTNVIAQPGAAEPSGAATPTPNPNPPPNTKP